MGGLPYWVVLLAHVSGITPARAYDQMGSWESNLGWVLCEVSEHLTPCTLTFTLFFILKDSTAAVVSLVIIIECSL